LSLGSLTALVVYTFRQFLSAPLWYDEQWRALGVSVHGALWRNVKEFVGGPSALGWLAIERLFVDVLGNRAVALRLPNFVALFFVGLATYVLARRFTPPLASLLVAVLVILDVPMLAYGLQLKPYLMEAAASAAILGLWLGVQPAPPPTAGEAAGGDRASLARLLGRLLPSYLAITALVLIATPTLFLLPGLLGYDVVRAFRRGGAEKITRWALAGMVAVAGAAHYMAFLRPQHPDVGASYWNPAYLPVHDGLPAMLRFLGTQLPWIPRMIASAGLLPPDTIYPGVRNLSLARPIIPVLTSVTVAAASVALVMGTASALRRRELRPVAVVVLVALVSQLAASGERAWPFGANRSNLFLVPLLAVLAAGGITAAVRSARRSRLVLVGVAVLSVALLGVVPLQGTRLRQLSEDGNGSGIYWGMARAVADVRAHARPTDVVVLADPNPPGSADFAGWLYFMYDYEGLPPAARSRPPVARSRTALLQGLPMDRVGAFLAAHPSSQRAYVLELWDLGTADMYPDSVAGLQTLGWCATRWRPVPATGLMIQFERGCQPSSPETP
jgi:hypothetical protein